MQTVGERLRYARDELRGLSQPGLARAVKALGTDITYQTIQAIEGGGGTKHLNVLAKALNVRLDWLEFGREPMEESAPAEPPHMLDREHWRTVLIRAERVLQENNVVMPPEAKADYLFVLYDVMMEAREPEKFDPAKYPNIIELFAKR